MQKELLKQRLYNQSLIEPAVDVHQLVQQNLGIQSQYINYGLFNIFYRMKKGITSQEVCEDLILAWGQRETYHFYTKELWQEMVQLFSGKPSLWEKIFEKRGVDVEKEYEKLQELLVQRAYSRQELKEVYGTERFKQLFGWGGLFTFSARKGKLYQKLIDNERVVYWNEKVLPPVVGLKEQLLERYFSAYGPATLKDAAHFFGVPLKFFDKEIELPYKEFNQKKYYYKQWHHQIEIPEVILLGKFDPMLVSYDTKEILIPKEFHKDVWKPAAQISSVLLIHGEYAGVWSFTISGDAIQYTITPNCLLSKQQKEVITQQLSLFAKFMNKNVKEITINEV